MNAEEVLRASIPPGRQFRWAVVLGVLANASAVALLATSMWLIVSASERVPMMMLSFAVVGVRAFALGRAGFRYAERLTSHDGVLRQLPVLRVRLFERLADLAPWGITSSRRGDALSRFVRDVDELQFYPLRAVLPVISAAVVAVLTGAIIALFVPYAALVIAIALAVGVGLATVITQSSARASARLIAPARGQLADAVIDAVGNWDLLVAYGADKSALDRVRTRGNTLGHLERHIARRNGLANAILIVLGGLAIVSAAIVVAPLAIGHSLSVPGAAVVVLIPIALADVLAGIPLAVNARASALGAAERIAELLPEQTPRGIPDERAEMTLPSRRVAPHPTLHFERMSASYPGEVHPALSDVTVTVRPGELLVLTGSSGSGKSTIAQVAVRLLDYEGVATLDGVEMRDVGADNVRKNVVLCEQHPWLFHTTIRGNLQFARTDVSEAELDDVINRVGLSNWILERGGLDAEVGERGDLVSGGQAQRLALARALLSNAPIIVCDEPTANVEPELAEQLLRDIARLTPQRSVVLITHQRLPAEIVARTVRVENGRLR